uniref:Uncharacterized protein n=1 Tax=Arundo donax TaxID=35708 RepID=A0A0A9H8Y0_ARUDO
MASSSRAEAIYSHIRRDREKYLSSTNVLPDSPWPKDC